ncbi:MAG: TlpA family protein disulfide reductase [Candidatus Omnitrophica bacterium]|nr:TlpA family protein disulfide reductase [Candidatus Omnitrophota bacterium]
MQTKWAKAAYCFFFVMLMAALSSCSRTNEAQAITGKAADFSLTSLEGEQIVLTELLAQEKVVLAFWASWCGYCRMELPRLENFSQSNLNRNKVAVLGVNIKEGPGQIKSFLKKTNLSFPIILDRNGEVARLYNVRGVPTLVAIDQDRTILYYGHSVEEMLKDVNF